MKTNLRTPQLTFGANGGVLDPSEVSIADAAAVLQPSSDAGSSCGAGAPQDNALRAARGLSAVARGQIDTPGSPWATEPVASALIDALANVRHLCDAIGLVYDDLDDTAIGHYRAEIGLAD